MAFPDLPNSDDWYIFPDGETVKVNSTGEEFVEIQYADGSLEMVEQAIWFKLGAEHVDAPGGDSNDDAYKLHELDFARLGVAPGTEGMYYNELYSDIE